MCSYWSYSQDVSIPKTYIAHKISDQITVDGLADEDVWQQTAWTEPFIDIEGLKIPKYKTQVKMLWDADYFYLFAKLEEPHVWANLVKRDTIIFYNNDFEVFIDPDGDAANYYELEMNALNTVWDLFIAQPYREKNNIVLNDFTILGLKSAVYVNGMINDPSDIDLGWTVELAIPWKTFKTGYFDDRVPNDQFWRVNFSRVNWDHDFYGLGYARKKDDHGKLLPEYNWVWSPQQVVNMHEPERWGYVYFSSKQPGANEDFQIPEDEWIKWKLFEIYRAQKAHFSTHKKWCTSLAELGFESFGIKDQTIEVELENHSQGYNVLITSPFTQRQLIIQQDGKLIIQ